MPMLANHPQDANTLPLAFGVHGLGYLYRATGQAATGRELCLLRLCPAGTHRTLDRGASTPTQTRVLDMGFRSNFHQIEKRVEDYIFITVLAFQRLCWIPTKLLEAGERRRWSAICRLLRVHSTMTTLGPVKQGNSIAILKPTEPSRRGAGPHLSHAGIDLSGAYKGQKNIFRK